MLLTDWLEERGLVERRRRPDDARSWGVHLTPRGERFVSGMKRRVLAEDRKRAAVLDARERKELLRLLNKLAR
jgi:DNA-binding MarR family transcriptional regulator